MRSYLYLVFKQVIRLGFHCYYKEIRMVDQDRIPEKGAIMLLPNHQSALMDPLLYAAFAKGKPYFLTRSDVFKNPVLRWVFEGLRMMPIYRLRDGRATLERNREVFQRCAVLFSEGEQVLLFPEANHSLRRRVRPLSKGFTRILTEGFIRYPGMQITIVPAGMNYQNAAGFPDRVAMNFGVPIQASEYWSEEDKILNFSPLRERVHQAMTGLTTHVPYDMDLDKWESIFEAAGANFLDPIAINAQLERAEVPKPNRKKTNSFIRVLWDIEFRLVNPIVWLPWRWISKNKVPEPEFMSTFRFLYCFLVFPVYFLLLGVSLSFIFSVDYAAWVLLLLFLHNFIYVKFR